VARLLDAFREPSEASLLRLERGTAAWAPAGPGALHRRLAVALHRRALREVGHLDLPSPIGNYYAQDFERIMHDLAERADADLTFVHYRFKADLRLLALHRIPMGMYDLDGTAIPGRTLLRQAAWGALRLARVVFRCGGLAPFFSQHMVPHRVHLFSPEGRAHYLELLAQVLRRRPRIRGLVSAAWYNDPVVGRISPHLAYLREGLEALGGQTFRIGTTAEVVEDALVKSATRRRLHAAGTYVPTAYMIVVPRDCLLRAVGSPEDPAGDAR